MADPISDMLVRIKNAQRAGHKTAIIPFSKFKLAVAKVLENGGYVGSVERKGKKVRRFLEIGLLYDENKKPVLSEIKRISKQSRRVYVSRGRIKHVRSGLGLSIISTTKGVMSGKEAKRAGLGGEVIAEVW